MLLLELIAAALAAAAVPVCAVDVYVVDHDQTSNVRLAPSADAKIEAKIDPSYAVVRITGVSGNWFRVGKIHDADSDMLLFDGDGWVHRSLLGLSVAGGEHWLQATPAAGARKVMKLTPDGNKLEPLDCRGDWLKVRVDGTAEGWIDRAAQCSNPMTTCS